MSQAKRELEQVDEYYYLVRGILLEIGAIDTCEIHGEFYYNTYSFDEEDIYAIVTAKAKEHYNGAYVDYKQLHEVINKILSEAADGADDCPRCEKLNKE